MTLVDYVDWNQYWDETVTINEFYELPKDQQGLVKEFEADLFNGALLLMDEECRFLNGKNLSITWKCFNGYYYTFEINHTHWTSAVTCVIKSCEIPFQADVDGLKIPFYREEYLNITGKAEERRLLAMGEYPVVED